MSTEALRKAVEALRLNDAVGYETFSAIWKGMRDQEAEIARLREDRDSHQRLAVAAMLRAEQADAWVTAIRDAAQKSAQTLRTMADCPVSTHLKAATHV